MRTWNRLVKITEDKSPAGIEQSDSGCQRRPTFAGCLGCGFETVRNEPCRSVFFVSKGMLKYAKSTRKKDDMISDAKTPR